MICRCSACTCETHSSTGQGLEVVAEGLRLACSGCGAISEISPSKIHAHWSDQVRRDRVLALAGIDVETLYGA